MSNESFFDSTDARLATGSALFSAKINLSPTTYGLVASQATSYAAKDAEFQTAYQTSQDPETRTKAATAVKNAKKKALKAMASDLAKIIDGSPVTDAQKIELGLHVRANPSPIGAPATAPKIDILSTSGRTVVLRLHDSVDANRRGKPKLVSGAAVFSYVGATPPDDTNAWTFEGLTSRVKFPVQFPTSVAAGAQVWFTAFWFNERKQSGPAADRVTTNIPGGSVTVAS